MYFTYALALFDAPDGMDKKKKMMVLQTPKYSWAMRRARLAVHSKLIWTWNIHMGISFFGVIQTNLQPERAGVC